VSDRAGRDDLDATIDAALRSMTEGPGPADIRDRVLARLGSAGSRRRFSAGWLPLAAATAGLAGLVATAVLRDPQPPAVEPSAARQGVDATPRPAPPVAAAAADASQATPRPRRLPPLDMPPGLPLLEIPTLEPPRRVAVSAVPIEPQVLEPPQVIPAVELRPIEIDGDDPVDP